MFGRKKQADSLDLPEQPLSVLTAADLQSGLSPDSERYATQVIDRTLLKAIEWNASDIHLQFDPRGMSVSYRIDGVIQYLGIIPNGVTVSLLHRLKAMAGLLTYRSDLPQEGRLQIGNPPSEMRLCTIPVLDGERVVIRLARRTGFQLSWNELALPNDVREALDHTLHSSAGVILIAGRAGAGKTTTAYACLKKLQESSIRRSLVTLEDPIEASLPGVAQSQVQIGQGYDWQAGLRAVLRQDPDILFIGEIRDAETAAIVFQAGLAGQLVISTIHSGTAAEALRRLIDMKIPAHLIRSSLKLLLCQRLARKLCNTPGCVRREDLRTSQLGQNNLCSSCRGTGYSGRFPLVELLPPLDGPLGDTHFLEQATAQQIEQLAKTEKFCSLRERAHHALEQGQIDQLELQRIALLNE